MKCQKKTILRYMNLVCGLVKGLKHACIRSLYFLSFTACTYKLEWFGFTDASVLIHASRENMRECQHMKSMGMFHMPCCHSTVNLISAQNKKYNLSAKHRPAKISSSEMFSVFHGVYLYLLLLLIFLSSFISYIIQSCSIAFLALKYWTLIVVWF